MKAPANSKNTILPLPSWVVKHHLETLLPWIENWREQKRVPPVLLLTGIEGVGKRSMGHFIAQWLLCEKGGFSEPRQESLEQSPDLFGGSLFGDSPTPAPTSAPTLSLTEGPCGECLACRKALQSSWVDFSEIGSDANEDEQESGKIKLEAFRELKNSTGFGALEGSYRIFLIRNAERLTPQAANSLLKLLEEPPPSWIFILTASDSSLLLPTLISRCQRIRLKPFSDSLLRETLSNSQVSRDRIPLCIELAQGSWKKALALAEDPYWEKREQVLRFFENPPEQLNPLLEWASASSESLVQLIDLVEPIQMELVRWAAQATHFQAPHSFDRFLTSHLKYAAMHLQDIHRARHFWVTRAERIARARHEVTLPLNKKLLTQEILLPYLLS